MLSEATLSYLSTSDLIYRKSTGQYFTDSKIREQLFGYLPKMTQPKIAELSVGTGEFLSSIYQHFNEPEIWAYDIDKTVLNIAKSQYPQANYSVMNGLDVQETGFDFVIGNPPYMEIDRNEVSSEFATILSGRPNLYALFIKKGLDLLKPGGYLGFVVPTSMNNGAYFSKLREYILQHASIEQVSLLDNDSFIDAQQATQIIILRKNGIYNTKHIFSWAGHTLIVENSVNLVRLFEGAQTLAQQGYVVKTGNVVWNQHKSKLSDDKQHTLLIWSKNIVDGGVILNKPLQYIKHWQPEYTFGIVVNRITGAGKNAKLRAALVSQPFAAENHVNVISGNDLSALLIQLRDPRGLEAIKQITGNTQLSKTELQELYPVWKGDK